MMMILKIFAVLGDGVSRKDFEKEFYASVML